MALSKEKFEIVIQINEKWMTEYIMQRDNLNEESAYKKLIDMEIYKLMVDQDSGIWGEFKDYFVNAAKLN